MSLGPHVVGVGNIPTEPDYTGVTIIELTPVPALKDYMQAMQLANTEAEKAVGEPGFLVWVTGLV